MVVERRGRKGGDAEICRKKEEEEEGAVAMAACLVVVHMDFGVLLLFVSIVCLPTLQTTNFVTQHWQTPNMHLLKSLRISIGLLDAPYFISIEARS
jgi:hypothetical protein